MNIETIQKRKFLTNIYKLYYSLGSKPSDHELKQAFNRYFSVNKFGEPVNIDVNKLQSTAKMDPHILNELMANTILNLEVLYDCVMESNEEIFSTITSINHKIDGLRYRRKNLESKIDQLLFSNSNSDGYFYSFLENFSSLSNIDMSLTSAYIDIANDNAKLPKLTSQASNSIASQIANISNIKQTIMYNNNIIASSQPVSNFDTVFDGLNDTFWSIDQKFQSPGVVSLVLDIPIGSGFTISKIEGSLLSIAPCSVFLKAVKNDGTNEVRAKESKDDYNRFSFSIPNDIYSQVSLTLLKSEPDKVMQDATSPYLYSFGIRELSIGADYYTERAHIVSSPISIPTKDNTLLSISAISIDAKQQIVPGTDLSFYIAQDIPNYSSLYDFNWIQVQPNEFDSTNQNIINLLDPIYVSESIDSPNENITSTYSLIPLNNDAQNANELNPIILPFSDKTVYRVASINDQQKYLQPSMISGLDTFSSYWISSSSSKVTQSLYKSLDGWASLISAGGNDLYLNSITNTSSTFSSTFNGPGSELFQANILISEERNVSHDIYKLDGTFNLAIYLNGMLIADLPKGISNPIKVEWNFVKGINKLAFLIDYDTTTRVSFELMHGAMLSDYGTVFLDYFTYLDPLEFRKNTDTSLNTFTIDNVYGSKQILANKEISKRTILKYYLDKSKEIQSIRYRVDFNRYLNPLQTPILDAIRVKFKHNDA